MNSAIVRSIATALPLLGIASADIIMAGGDINIKARPLRFCLTNIVMY